MRFAALLCASGLAVAQTPPPPSAREAERSTQSTPRPAAPRVARAPTPAPAKQADAAVLEYLGEFDDAADGLDAMGLQESSEDVRKANAGGR